MTIVGIDDTDSRTRGMCTTYLGVRIADALRERGVPIRRLCLVRLNPAIEHKTRGNAAVAVHADCDPDVAFGVATELIDRLAETDDPNTRPGLVVAPDRDGSPDAVVGFARRALHERHDLEEALALIEGADYRQAGWAGGRGRIGALAAVGVSAPSAGESDDPRSFEGWTYEHITYRERERWGTPRVIDPDSVFAAAAGAYPEAWDTVDRGTGDLVCVPSAPGPVLHGIRGDDPETVREVAGRIESEPAERMATFLTNQGTDAHLLPGEIATARDGRAYRLEGTVSSPPETRRGGHVFLTIEDGERTMECAAFEPTKRFRNRVRALRTGDRIVACGEVSDGTLKLEKFAVRELNRIAHETPDCPDCGRSMESAGRDQGYRCRDCGTSSNGKVEIEIERDLESGWYEVPPCARRHVAKPLVRGGFDAPIHPER
ncbi:tRNA(Ile)(2)-agmatinylcytidine synthase [Halalkalicoccus salilacus]|uniref:tRNA(Ile)(2)-agmatinylcytidine synthase n=1 Tax=Halalkalicoccus salilacus TaxID=3117459 RepID=UPI00300ED39E